MALAGFPATASAKTVRRRRRSVAEMLDTLEAYQRGQYQPTDKHERRWLKQRSKVLSQ